MHLRVQSIVGSGVKLPSILFYLHPFYQGTLLTENSDPHPFYNLSRICSSTSSTNSPAYWTKILSIFHQPLQNELHHYFSTIFIVVHSNPHLFTDFQNLRRGLPTVQSVFLMLIEISATHKFYVTYGRTFFSNIGFAPSPCKAQFR